MRETIQKALAGALATIGIHDGETLLEYPAELAHGDFATSAALKYAKAAGLSPRALAEKIVEALGSIDGVEKMEIAGAGFINFRLSARALNEIGRASCRERV